MACQNLQLGGLRLQRTESYTPQREIQEAVTSVCAEVPWLHLFTRMILNMSILSAGSTNGEESAQTMGVRHTELHLALIADDELTLPPNACVHSCIREHGVNVD